MTYELALALKNAGFPQEDPYVKSVTITNENIHEILSKVKGDCRIPSLSELIEACGAEFYALWVRGDNTWFACKDLGDVGAEGSTPEEAVANLWLSLNEK